MKIGTDGMILGAWANTKGATKILDIGTGTGLLAFMLAQRSGAEIDAIEVEEKAFIQAQENVIDSPWKDQIHVILSSLQDFSRNCHKIYDLVICNPPFYTAPNKEKGNNKQTTYSAARASARFVDTLTQQELLDGVKNILDQHGKFVLILPTFESKSFITKALNSGFKINKILHIKSRSDLPEFRVILELGFEKKDEIEEEEFIIYDAPNKYSNQYIKLTKEYHFKEF